MSPTADVFGAIAATGPVSPRGVPAAGVDASVALARADANLRAAPADIAEARFWLQAAIGQAIGQKDVGRAMSRLGALHAAAGSSGEGMARARVLWEIAAAQGDALALCSLAAMYERGIGVPKDHERAKTFFSRAAGAGGCSDAASALPKPLSALKR